MASTYSPLKIELIGTGEQVATWGQTTNTNLGTAIEQAIGGKADVTMSSTSEQLTLTDTNAAQNARALYLNLTGTPGGAATLEVPAVQKAYIVRNATTGGFAVTVKVAGQTGVSVPNGATMHLYNNGTDVVNAITNLPAGATVGGAAISTGSGTVSSVAAGNGMNFSTITSTGSVTLGTPSTLNTTTTNLVSGSTHTHAITTASASTASTIVARDSLGGFEATTISMTTGNIGTLNVGTQSGKATISYTTNAARTLTVPAVSGNRTFAFLEEAQVFTVNQTIDANLIFTNNNRRIIGPMSNTLISERLMFQTSATNNITTIGAIPSGSGTESRLSLFNDTDTVNMESLDLRATATEHIVRSGAAALGAYLPLSFYNGNVERMRITANGEIIFTGNGIKLQGKFDNYDNNSTIFQDATTNATTTLNVAPNGTGAASAVHINSSSDLTNSIVGALLVDSNEVSLFSLYTGSNSFQPLNLVNGGAIYVQVNSDGTVLMPGVYGSTVGGTNRDLYIDDTGKLGYLTSTRKSKTNIAPIEDTSWLMNLEPVSFNRRVQASGGLYTDQAHKNTEFGLIADDAVQVRPEICFNDDFGNLSGIHYEQLIAPMLKEIQKLRAEVEALKAKG